MVNKDKIIAELRKSNSQQAKLIAELFQRIAELELQLAKALKNSSNSSKSPSSDIVKPPKKKIDRRKKKAKRGGQKGHQRNLREPLPPERVDEQITCEINDADLRKRDLTPTNDFEIVQHVELLDLPIYVTEYRLRKYLDSDGNTVLPDVPEIQDRPIFGPRLLSMIGWLKSRAHCSYTTIGLWMSDVLQVPVSRGYLAKLCNGTISSSLSGAHDELKQAISEQPQLGSDESSLKNNGKKNWIWCITAPLFTLFHIATSRSRAVLEELIGTDYDGFIHFDYFSANCSFTWNFDMKAQYCWAHLIRDIRFLLKHPDKRTKAWAEQLLDRSRRTFSAWHRRDEMTDAGFHRSMITHRDRFLDIVRKPPDSKEAANLAARFQIVEMVDGSVYDMSQDYFRFMFASGVEPTNNHSEQQIRHCVIDRRITQGTRSESGQRYHERMWTAIATCDKQGLSFFQFLHESLTAKLTSTKPPTLLPR
jgi:transposase